MTSVAGRLGLVAPGSKEGWRSVILLCVLFLFSMVDRLVLGLLTVDIGRDLHATDAQLGLVIGTAFAMVYSIAGLPIAHFLDHGNRKRLIVAGVVLWSLMTMLSAFAPNIVALGLCRSGMALGEAVLTPGAVSLIADLFAREKRILPTACYSAMSVITIGGLIIGAAAFQLAQHLAPVFGLSAWRLTLVLTGLPPLLVGLIFAWIASEPRRGQFDDPVIGDEPPPGMGACWVYLRTNRRFYLPLYFATATIMIYLFGIMTWAPTLMIRAHGVSPAKAGYYFGMLGMVLGVAGATVWPRLAVVLGRRGHRDPIMTALATGVAFGTPFITIGAASHSLPLFLAGTGLGLFGCSTVAALMPVAIQSYGPPRMRARLASITSFAQSLIGYGLGPVLIAELAKAWPQNPMALGYALSVAGAVAGPLTAILYVVARRSLRDRPLA